MVYLLPFQAGKLDAWIKHSPTLANNLGTIWYVLLTPSLSRSNINVNLSTNEVTSKIRNQDYKIEKLSFHSIIDFTFESHIYS